MRTFNDPNLTLKRRTMRKERPLAERLLWTRISARQLLGFRFRMQHGVGPYFADFYCAELKLAIEIDGPSHESEEAERHDQKRSQLFESLGIQTIRFTNKEVLGELDGVLEQIGIVLKDRSKTSGNKTSPYPSATQRGPRHRRPLSDQRDEQL